MSNQADNKSGKPGSKPCSGCETVIVDAGYQASGIGITEEQQDQHAVICPVCGLRTNWEFSPEEALRVWDSRPIEDALQARIDYLDLKVITLEMQLENEKDPVFKCVDGDGYERTHYASNQCTRQYLGICRISDTCKLTKDN